MVTLGTRKRDNKKSVRSQMRSSHIVVLALTLSVASAALFPPKEGAPTLGGYLFGNPKGVGVGTYVRGLVCVFERGMRGVVWLCIDRSRAFLACLCVYAPTYTRKQNTNNTYHHHHTHLL